MMNVRVVMVFLVCVVMGATPLLGCKSGKGQKGDELSNRLRIPEHFKNIPADTPYVFADIKAMPSDDLDWPIGVESYQAVLDQLEVAVIADIQAMSAEMRTPEDRFLLALFNEFDGRMNEAGLKELGIAPEAHVAIYGIGMFPAMRLELSDGEKFEAMLKRLEASVGESMPVVTHGERTFRAIEEDEMFLPVIVTDTELLVGFSSAKFKDTFLPLLLGETKPETSLYDDNKLLAMQKTYGLLPYLSGYIDTKGMMDGVLDVKPTTLFGASLISLGEKPPQISDVCRAEYRQLAADAPRVVFGYTEVSRTNLHATMGIELTNDMPQRIRSAKAAIPGFGSTIQRDAFASFGAGVDVSKMIAVVKQEAKRLATEEPFACEDLTVYNVQAENLYFGIESYLPPQLQSVQGMSLTIYDMVIDMKASTDPVKKLDVLAVMRAGNPDEVWGMISGFIENAVGVIDVPKNGQPVAVPLPQDIQTSAPSMPTPMVAMTDGAIAIAAGEAMTDAMVTQMNQDISASTPMLSMSYNPDKVFAFLEESLPPSLRDQTMMLSGPIYESFGPSRFTIDMRERGLFFDTNITIVPSEPDAP